MSSELDAVGKQIGTDIGTYTGTTLRSFLGELREQLAALLKDFQAILDKTLRDALQQVDQLLLKLDDLLRDRFETPLRDLGDDVRAAATTIYLAAWKLGRAAGRLAKEGWLVASASIAMMEQAMLEFKAGIPFIAGSNPRLRFFKFASEELPGVISEGGGRVDFFGFRLWTKEARPPTITVSVDGQQVLAPPPDRSGGDDSFAIVIPKPVLDANPNKVLIVRVIAHEEEFFVVKDTRLEIPLKVSRYQNTKFEVEAETGIEFVERTERPGVDFSWGGEDVYNRDTSRAKDIGETTTTQEDVSLRADERIVRVEAFDTFSRGAQVGVYVRPDGRAVYLKGRLEQADRKFDIPEGLKIEPTYFVTKARTFVIRREKKTFASGTVVSNRFDLDLGSVLMLLPRGLPENPQDLRERLRYALFASVGDSRAKILDSGFVEVGNGMTPLMPGQAPGLVISGEYTAGPIPTGEGPRSQLKLVVERI